MGSDTQWASGFMRVYRHLRHSFSKFLKAMNFTPTAQQQQIVDAIENGERYIANKSGQGAGKSAIWGFAGIWRAFRNVGARTFVTAPTMRQAKDVFLAEIRQNLHRADPFVASLFDVQATKVVICGVKNWGLELVTATRAENFQGLHNKWMTILADEASGISNEIIETIMGTLTNKDRLCGFFGNPNTRDCMFFKCFGADRARWHCLTFDTRESPDWVVDKSNIERMIDLYGADSDIVRIRVYGEFPRQDPKCVMNSDDLEACTRNNAIECATGARFLEAMPKGMQRKQFGLDFARYGQDKSVVYRRSGLALVESDWQASAEPSQLISKAFAMQARVHWANKECYFVADADGMGQGLMHIFYDADRQLYEFHNGGRAYESDTYYDAATEAMFELSHLVKQRLVYIPNDAQLIQELSTRQYATAKGSRGKGRLVLESKEDYVRRTGHDSPDKGDAAMMAFYPYVFGRVQMAGRQKTKSRSRVQ